MCIAVLSPVAAVGGRREGRRGKETAVAMFPGPAGRAARVHPGLHGDTARAQKLV